MLIMWFQPKLKKLDHFPSCRGENSKDLGNHHLEYHGLGQSPRHPSSYQLCPNTIASQQKASNFHTFFPVETTCVLFVFWGGCEKRHNNIGANLSRFFPSPKARMVSIIGGFCLPTLNEICAVSQIGSSRPDQV